MQYQVKRSIAFLISNLAVTIGWGLAVWVIGTDRIWTGDPAFIAGAILVLVPAHIAARILVMVGFGAARHCAAAVRGGEAGDPIDLEDELDKLIDLKATRLGSWFFLLGALAGLACLAFGQPPQALVLGIGAGMVLSGLAGDLATLAMYRRGV